MKEENFNTNDRNTKNSNKPILILGAMDCEITFLISYLKNKEKIKILGYPVYRGQINGISVIIAQSYVGTTNAAILSTICIEKFDPWLVICQGTSGAHDKNLHQGDIILGEKIIDVSNYYTDKHKKGEGIASNNWKLSDNYIVEPNGYVKFLKNLESDSQIINAISKVNYSEGHIYKGTLATSNAWNKEIDKIVEEHTNFNSSCEEMESFSVAQVCKSFNKRFVAIRIISNSEFHNEDFTPNYGEICQKFIINTIPVIQNLK